MCVVGINYTIRHAPPTLPVWGSDQTQKVRERERERPETGQFICALCHLPVPSRSAYDNRNSFDKNRFQHTKDTPFAER